MGSIGNRLRIERKLNELSIDEVSKRTGVAVGTISALENDRMQGSITTIIKLAKLYGSSIDDIAFGYGDGYDD